jgi:hypothetical protein
MTILTIVQNICREIGVAPPSTLIGSSDETAIQFLAIANRSGESLSKAHPWQRLIKEHTFSTVASTDSYALPTDIQDPPGFIEGTLWDRTNNWRLLGPTDAVKWQALISGITGAAASVSSFFRVRTNLFYLYPTPSSVRTIAYEYPSINWCENAAQDTEKAAFTVDTDLILLPDKLYKMDLIWRFRKAKGLSYAAEMVEFTEALEKDSAADGGAPIVTLGGVGEMQFAASLPDTDIGL